MRILLFSLLFLPFFVKSQTTNYHLGQHAEGGIIYQIYYDSIGKQHGLVLSTTNVSDTAQWGSKDKDLENCESTWDGKSNTNAILFASRDTLCAAGLCDAFVSENYDDWYLPALYELIGVYSNLFLIDKALSDVKGSDPITLNLYWSSTESNGASAWFFSFFDGKPSNYYDKTSITMVRAVRSF